MKKLLLVFTFFGLIGNISGQNLKALDAKNGFRNYKFGYPLDSFKDMKLIDSNQDTKFYENTAENLKLGDFEIVSVVIQFYKGMLSGITLHIKGYSNYRGVLSAMQSQFGKGVQDNPYIEHYNWTGKEETAVYKENSVQGTAVVYFWSNSIYELEKKDKAVKAKKAGEGF